MTIGNAYLTRMPIGFVGLVNRQDQATLQPEILDATDGPVLYGTFVKYNATGKIVILESGDAATVIKGLIARPYPVQETSTPGGTLGVPGIPNLALPGDIMKRGYMIVAFAGTTAAKGGQVYVCINVAGGNALGEIFEGADGGNNVAVANCFFMGAADDSKVEVSYNMER